MKHRVVLGILVTTAVLLAGVLVMYAFGTPQAPRVVAGTGSQPVAGTQASPDAPVAIDGDVPAPDPNSPLAIQIPGCVCHSDDPKVVEEHSQYRMNQCYGCHKDGMPEEMGQ